MAVVRRPVRRSNPLLRVPLMAVALLLFIFLLVLIVLLPDGNNKGAPDAVGGKLSVPAGSDGTPQQMGGKYASVAIEAKHRLRNTVLEKRKQLLHALDSLSSSNMPARLRILRDKHQIVGERLSEIASGSETVEEVVNGGSGPNYDVSSSANENPPQKSAVAMRSDKPPMQLNEIIDFLTNWIHTLHDTLLEAKHETYEGIWQSYHDLTVKTLYPWDREYLSRMPPRRDDGSIFLSLATYRDENCFNTVFNAYAKAKNPDKLYIGMVQQNCHHDCKSGVLEGGKIEGVPPDDDCYEKFCATPEGKKYCDNNQVRNLEIDEPESLGPYAARYFASKLWYGEQWFMQTDAHMTFAEHWDSTSVEMLQAAPSKKPVLSHYPPPHTVNLEAQADKAPSRLCGPMFASSSIEAQIIRLEGARKYDFVHIDVPRFAPFTAAGYFVAHSDFLREVPFDPFLPWIFMGEEIIMSTRLWTSGYDIFSPSQAVVGHMFGRRHKPKFWESVHRAFSVGVHNPLQALVLDRVKYQLGYPESAKDMLWPKSILTAVEQYSMGNERSLEDYMKMVGLNMTSKEVTITNWCETGSVPPGSEHLAGLYKEKVSAAWKKLKAKES